MNIEDPPKSAWLRAVAQIKLERGCEDPIRAGFPRGYARVLSFDHGPGELKLFEISQALRRKIRIGRHLSAHSTGGSEEVLRTIAWQDIFAEIEKCDVVCKNCHEVRNTERSPGSLEEGDNSGARRVP